MNDRRNFIKSLVAVGGAVLAIPDLLLPCSPASSVAWSSSEDIWTRVPFILQQIRPPAFPSHDFDITEFGAVSDGKKSCTDAFRKAITACSKAGGGRVLVPEGTFLTGAIHLTSNVNLHLAAGGIIKFSRDDGEYLPLVFTRWEGIELMNYSPFIYAFARENIAITGEGTIDGQADNEYWWPWVGRKEFGWNEGGPNQRNARRTLQEMAEKTVPVRRRVFGRGSFLRPQFIQPYRCNNVLIEGVTIKNSPMWEIHPVLCRNVTVRKVRIISHGPNNDGCNPESCHDVLIKDCHFDTGDDCIAIKSGRNADGRRLNRASENIIIQDCEMKDGHGGVTVGSEISGGARNVFAESCRMDSRNLDRALRIKTNAMRGGVIQNIYMRNVEIGQVKDAAVHVDFYYEEGEAGRFTPVVRNIEVKNVKSAKSKYALYLRGFKRAPIVGLRLEDCTFDNVAQPNVMENVRDVELHNVRINGKFVSEKASQEDRLLRTGS